MKVSSRGQLERMYPNGSPIGSAYVWAENRDTFLFCGEVDSYDAGMKLLMESVELLRQTHNHITITMSYKEKDESLVNTSIAINVVTYQPKKKKK